ncbi:hypothetical protein D3C85_1691720 [compost metagenome]
MHHFGLGIRLQGKEIKYPHFGQQAFDKREVIFLILVNLFPLWVVSLEGEFILPAFQAMLLKDLSDHFRYRLVDEKAVSTELVF